MNENNVQDEDEDDYKESFNSTEEVVVPKSKRIWKPEEKKKIKEKEENTIIKTNLKYENKELIDRMDDIAIQLLKESGHNKHRDHFFPMMIEKLGYKTGAEIGVDKGEFSKHILSKTKIEKYYCIDTWQDNFGSDCKPGYYDKEGSKRYEAALNTLNEYVHGPRAIIMRMTSMEAASRIEDNSLDFVYIDGDHSLQGVLFDIYAFCPKVKIGGMLGFHDYKDGPRSGICGFFGDQLDYKVKTCVDYYCQRWGHKVNPVGGRILSAWFIKNR